MMREMGKHNFMQVLEQILTALHAIFNMERVILRFHIGYFEAFKEIMNFCCIL